MKRKAYKEDVRLVWEDELFGLDLLNNDPWALASSVGVTILSDKDFLCGHVDFNFRGEGGVIVSALFTGWDGEKYSFDTVVHREYQGQGLGSELIEIGIGEFEQYKESDPDAKMELDVINKDIISFLERKYGLEVKEQQGGHYIMASNYSFSWHCPSPPDIMDWQHTTKDDLTNYTDMVDYISEHAEEITPQEFFEVIPEEVVLEDLWAGSVYDEYFKIEDDNYISWNKSKYPDGTPVYYHTHSGIEHVYEPVGYYGPKNASSRALTKKACSLLYNWLKKADDPAEFIGYHCQSSPRNPQYDDKFNPAYAERFFSQILDALPYDIRDDALALLEKRPEYIVEDEDWGEEVADFLNEKNIRWIFVSENKPLPDYGEHCYKVYMPDNIVLEYMPDVEVNYSAYAVLYSADLGVPILEEYEEPEETYDW